MENVMIRYGRIENGWPKNTLVTVRKEDRVYFGISRCLLSEDRPKKSEGREEAKRKLQKALSEADDDWRQDGSLLIHSTGHFGVVSADEVPRLLEYFRNVDKICKEERDRRWRKSR